MKNQPASRAQQYAPPALRENNVVRSRCLHRIGTAHPGSVVVIVAGAGCGKSTLLRQLYDQAVSAGDRIWIALEERDASVEELWSLLAQGFAALDREITSEALDRISSHGLSNVAQIAAALARGVEARRGRIKLFIDDYQFAAEGDAAKLIQELVRRQPQNLQVFIASRVAPQLRMEAMKVENRLVDLTWRELAFDQSETAQFFQVDANDAAALRAAERLRNDTEGWAAGLQLALMKTRLADSRSGPIGASGYSNDVAQYFKSEILEALPPKVRDFLVRTSALDRFNDALAAEVAGVAVEEARQIFDFLDGRGFFLISLEGEGKWRRYHHLVQEFLSDLRAESRAGTEDTPEFLASLWFEKRSLIADAIEYAIRAGCFDRASDLVEAHAMELFSRGAAIELAAWIGRIPGKIIVKRPQLPLYLCLISAHMRQPIEGLRLQYDRCRQVISTLNAVGHFKSEDEYATLLTELDVAEAIIRFRAGDMAGVIEAGATILERRRPIRTTFSACLHNIIGYACYTLGDSAKARASLTIARDLHLAAGSVFGVVFAEAFKGMVSLSDGTTTAAQRHFAAAHQHAVSELGENSLPTSIAELYSTVLRYEVNEPIDEQRFSRVLADCRFCCEPEIYAAGLVTRYHLISRRNSPAEAREALSDATTYAREIGNDLIYLHVRYTALLHELNRGSLAAAVEIHADAQALWSGAPVEHGRAWDRKAFWRDLYCAEILLATAQPRKAAEIYDTLAAVTLRHNRIRRHVLVLAKSAIALASAGQVEKALAAMQKALQIAKPSRFVRTILDSGPRAIDLISLCGTETNDIELKLFIDSLPGVNADRADGAGIAEAVKQVVLDELTPKEIDVLRILTTGAKNREICKELQISENTVKWHMSRIFQKLGAANRTEAAMIAKSVFASL